MRRIREGSEEGSEKDQNVITYKSLQTKRASVRRIREGSEEGSEKDQNTITYKWLQIKRASVRRIREESEKDQRRIRMQLHIRVWRPRAPPRLTLYNVLTHEEWGVPLAVMC